MGELIGRALAACGVVKIPVNVKGILEEKKENHCAVLVTYPSGRMRGWILNGDESVREFIEENSESKCLRMARVPTEWYEMI
jgi:hypothetical protein